MKSAFTTSLEFEQPSSHEAMPTYRAVDQNGQVVDTSFTPDLPDEEVVKLYKHMLMISIMDVIMFDSQRQGRISFYMVSAGEEAVCVGSASALTPEDVIFCQYREQGVFAQRGFTPRDFMDQLFANKKDPGKGRNMPVHYGSKKLNIVCSDPSFFFWFIKSMLHGDMLTEDLLSIAHHIVPISNPDSSRRRRRLRPQNAAPPRSFGAPTGSGRLLWRRGRLGR